MPRLPPHEFGKLQQLKQARRKAKFAMERPLGVEMVDPKVQASQLRGIVQRIETIEQSIDELKLEVKDIYTEAKALGFDPKIIRKAISNRRKDQEGLLEEEALLQEYTLSVGDENRPLSFTKRKQVHKHERAKRGEIQIGGAGLMTLDEAGFPTERPSLVPKTHVEGVTDDDAGF